MWKKSASGVWFPTRSPKEFLSIYINGNDGNGIGFGPRCYARGQWSTQDFSDVLPLNCKAVEFGGVLIITHGTQPQSANLMIGFRATGETWNYWYDGQTIESMIGSGVRTNYTSGYVAVNQGKLDVWWDCLDMSPNPAAEIPVGAYPNQSSFGITLYARSAL